MRDVQQLSMLTKCLSPEGGGAYTHPLIGHYLITMATIQSTRPLTACPGGRGSELHLAGGESLLLHGDGAVAAQHGDAQLSLPLVRLLVPLVHHQRIKRRNERHLGGGQGNRPIRAQIIRGRVQQTWLSQTWTSGQLAFPSNKASRSVLMASSFTRSSPLTM